MMTNRLLFGATLNAFCALCLPAFCHAAPAQPAPPAQPVVTSKTTVVVTPSGQSAPVDPQLPGKPTLTVHPTVDDLDRYVQYFCAQGFTVVDRHQEYNRKGDIASFHFRATRPQGKPTPSSWSGWVETQLESNKMTETTSFTSPPPTDKAVAPKAGGSAPTVSQPSAADGNMLCTLRSL
jgi:hypothetical protein